MDTLVAVAQFVAYVAAIGAIASLVDRLLGDDDTGQATLVTTQFDPPWPRGVQEEEPLRWNVERLRRPTRSAGGRDAAAEPAARGLEGACSA
jgi:hypothetical protein